MLGFLYAVCVGLIVGGFLTSFAILLEKPLMRCGFIRRVFAALRLPVDVVFDGEGDDV